MEPMLIVVPATAPVPVVPVAAAAAAQVVDTSVTAVQPAGVVPSNTAKTVPDAIWQKEARPVGEVNPGLAHVKTPPAVNVVVMSPTSVEATKGASGTPMEVETWPPAVLKSIPSTISKTPASAHVVVLVPSAARKEAPAAAACRRRTGATVAIPTIEKTNWVTGADEEGSTADVEVAVAFTEFDGTPVDIAADPVEAVMELSTELAEPSTEDTAAERSLATAVGTAVILTAAVPVELQPPIRVHARELTSLATALVRELTSLPTAPVREGMIPPVALALQPPSTVHARELTSVPTALTREGTIPPAAVVLQPPSRVHVRELTSLPTALTREGTIARAPPVLVAAAAPAAVVLQPPSRVHVRELTSVATALTTSLAIALAREERSCLGSWTGEAVVEDASSASARIIESDLIFAG